MNKTVLFSEIIDQFNKKQNEIEAWFKTQWNQFDPPFYASVDLRHSEFKLAPVDVNLYPAGFNNLALEDETLAITQIRHVLQKKDTTYKNLLILTENHTRNLYYLEHLAKLKSLLNRAGYQVKLSTLAPTQKTTHLLSGELLSLEPASKTNNYLHIGDFIPERIILNNDLSEGLPDLLTDLWQPILPSPALGWYRRKKSEYFEAYHTICERFSNAFNWDDWPINPLFETCTNIDLTTPSDQTELTITAQSLLEAITKKYKQYHIEQPPYLIIKANSGSYGMGVLTINDASAIQHLSRKHRQHMSKTKGNRPIQSVILQEGIPTITRWQQSIAEPVIYFFGSEPIGGFYRVHTGRNAQENLNTPGMQLVPFTMQGDKQKPHDGLLYAYQVVARLAILAAALEMQKLNK